MKQRMSFSLLAVVVALAFVIGTAYAADNTTYTVYFNPSNGQYSVMQKRDEISGVAWAAFADERETTGWARFVLDSNPVYGDNIIAYGAGFLEGYVTYSMIWQEWSNTYANAFGSKPIPKPVYDFFNTNVAWMNSQVAANKGSPFWVQVGLVFQQLQGVVAGYNARASTSQRLDLIDFFVINSGGDLETILNKFANNTGSVRPGGFGTHCSSFFKVTPDLMEFYSGHTTWSLFYTMLRIFKSYTLRFRAAQTNAVTTLFSSYPGVISSIDDFYQLSPTKLVVVETTNGIVDNNSLYAKVVPQNLLSWFRVIVANRMATSSPNWVNLFSQYNSGTYNNQWIVADYKLFTPGTPLRDNLLWIAEQIPGYIQSADVTTYLRNGYWPSYNIPFFPYIYNVSGFPQAVQTIGDWLTYDLHPRAQIFRRDANKVSNFAEYQKLLRYNDWQNDPIADGSPGNQISSRFDLVPKDQHVTNPYLVRAPFGATDSKATSYALINQGRCFGQSGPTHDQQPPFSWSANDWGVLHNGLPDTFNFDWIDMPNGGVSSSKGL